MPWGNSVIRKSKRTASNIRVVLVVTHISPVGRVKDPLRLPPMLLVSSSIPEEVGGGARNAVGLGIGGIGATVELLRSA